MMGMTLYHGEPNGPSLTVLAALFEKGLDANLIPIDLDKGDRHGPKCAQNLEVEMSVEGEGPVLVANGEPMSDSVFIACYLDQVGQGPALRPADPYERWEMMAWCRYVIERVAPAAAFLGTRAYLAEPLAEMDDVGFDSLAATIANPDLATRWRDIRTGTFAADQAQDSESKITQAVARVEDRLAGRVWLMGEFSIADLETYAWLAGMVDLVPAAFVGAERTRAWLDRVASRPSVARALGLATVADPRRAWAPGPEINRWG
jgi:GST-like protein